MPVLRQGREHSIDVIKPKRLRDQNRRVSTAEINAQCGAYLRGDLDRISSLASWMKDAGAKLAMWRFALIIRDYVCRQGDPGR